jgi:hypothetical protein
MLLETKNNFATRKKNTYIHGTIEKLRKKNGKQ